MSRASKKADWLAINPKVTSWTETLKSATRSVNEDHLFQYFENYLSQKYSDVKTWLIQVRADQKSDEKSIVNHWALELKHFLDNHISKHTARHIGYSDKSLYASAIADFLNSDLAREVTYPYKIEPTVEEIE